MEEDGILVRGEEVLSQGVSLSVIVKVMKKTRPLCYHTISDWSTYGDK